MATGWLHISGTWYYFHDNGAMATGWLHIGGTWYYLHDSGAMAANCTLDIDGVSYTYSPSGAWLP